MLYETIEDKFILKAIQVAGGPGSGKSFVMKKVLSQFGKYEIKIYDSDTVFSKKLDIKQVTHKLAPIGSELRNQQMDIRNDAMTANANLLQNAFNGFLPVIIDGTGKRYQRYIEQKTALENLGYDVMCVMVNTSLEVAKDRNMKRTRSLTEIEVEEFWNMCQGNFKKYQQVYSTHLVVNNNPGQLDVNKLLSVTNKFFNEPIQNPIGQELQKFHKTGPLSRDVKQHAGMNTFREELRSIFFQ